MHVLVLIRLLLICVQRKSISGIELNLLHISIKEEVL